MSSGSGNFSKKREFLVKNSEKVLEKTSVNQVVFLLLTGIINEEKPEHLQSRKNVEQALSARSMR